MLFVVTDLLLSVSILRHLILECEHIPFHFVLSSLRNISGGHPNFSSKIVPSYINKKIVYLYITSVIFPHLFYTYIVARAVLSDLSYREQSFFILQLHSKFVRNNKLFNK